ncbi:MAG: hypothetical protein PHQ75_01955 [Thermoguttaceae bacterium]|nr:hypothetical protein [Thermoguttaceae bacterium]
MWLGLLAYNIVRAKMLFAARRKKINPRHYSFAMAYKTICNGYCQIPLLSKSQYLQQYNSTMAALRKQKVGHRPNRFELRKVKQRQKTRAFLLEPRSIAKQRLSGELPERENTTDSGSGKRRKKEPYCPSLAAESMAA